MKPYYFYTITFRNNVNWRPYFRLVTAPRDATHADRMQRFRGEIGDCMTLTGYEIDLSPAEMMDLGLPEYGFKDTYWSNTLEGAA
jgi:hypothetical protein